MKGNKIFKGILLAIVILLILSMLTPLVVHAEENTYGNAWVYDAPGVVSTSTEEYIKILNESTFASYKAKPQLAFIIINDLPYNIDNYKLDMFNEYGVGTEEENHGMLFVFAINDREYALEIGDGFEKGTILRKDLETDFITNEMKTKLRAGDYDSVVRMVAEHLANMMANEENGVYADREIKAAEEAKIKAEKYAADKAAAEEKMQSFGIAAVIVLVVAVVVIGVFEFSKWMYYKTKRRKIIDELVDKYYKNVVLLDTDIAKTVERLRQEFENDKPNEIEDRFISTLHQWFISDMSAELIERNDLLWDYQEYVSHLKARNNIKAFSDCQIVALDIVIHEVNDMETQKKQIRDANNAAVEEFLKSNDFRIQNRAIIDTLRGRFTTYRNVCDRLITTGELESHFVKNMENLSFEYEFNKFCEENKEKIDSRYFDKEDFFREIKRTNQYSQYHCGRNYNRTWMLHYLMIHMASQKKAVEKREREEQEARERRRREEEARRQRQMMQSRNSSFGSGFSGGRSSGGGFKGGW